MKFGFELELELTESEDSSALSAKSALDAKPLSAAVS